MPTPRTLNATVFLDPVTEFNGPLVLILNKGISLTFFQYRNLPNREFYDKLDGS